MTHPKFNFHKQRLYHYDALGRLIHNVVELRMHGKPMRQETHLAWQVARVAARARYHDS
ncbi:hypothetical protein QP597_19990 [Providencia stuartii]|nr:hypothetical protein [Providencia stuartii]